MFVTAIIAAGGRGTRFGGAGPKQLVTVGGRPILERSVAAFLSHPSVDEVIVALPSELAGNPPAYLRASTKPLRLVAGGARRQDSVANAFRLAAEAADVVVIHDAARPFASEELITRTIAAALESGAAVAALGARDTVKRVRSGPAEAGRHEPQRERPSTVERVVSETLPRETIFLAQTPQAFRRDVLAAALAEGERADVEATDEAALAERAGHGVSIVEGEATNIKITTPEDLPIAEAIARSSEAFAPDRSAEAFALRSTDEAGESSDRIRSSAKALAERSPKPARTGRAGTGYDLHRLVAGRPLILGGVTIPSAVGALGHSDADVVCHAITDAVLGAACLGDIGRHFPDSDPRWKDASSLDLLSRACALVREQGLEVGNVDVTVVLEQPRIKDHIAAMRAAVAGAIGIAADRVSIKGKTNEGVDAVGRGEAVAAHAIALIRAR